jgi:hypothetical protein
LLDIRLQHSLLVQVTYNGVKMPSILNSDSGAVSGSAGLKFDAADDGILEIQNDGVTSFVVSNQYIKVPSGNTASRPATAAPGMIRFNSESGVFEASNGSVWLNVSTPPPFDVEYLVVAGGGGGGTNAGGGGGAGGYRSSVSGERSGGNTDPESKLTVSSGIEYAISIGGGGTSAIWSGTGTRGTSGGNTSFASITSQGGGSGGIGGFGASTNGTGINGGSGGGAAAYDNTKAGGSGTTGQGFAGGTASSSSNGLVSTGGGGARGASPNNTSTSRVGTIGGEGIQSNITGTATWFAGGGSSDSATGASNGGTINGESGAANSGAGAGQAATGGSGVVILKYPDTRTISNPAGGLTFTTSTAVSGYKVTTFTAGTGNIQFS